MPNHVANRLTIVGKRPQVEALMNFVKNDNDDDGLFDFNKIIPMPEELQGTTSPPRIISEADYKKYQKNPPKEDISLGLGHPITKKMFDDYMERFGAADWYEWRCAHWGTKWGAYNVDYIESIGNIAEGEMIITYMYDTAWATSTVIIEKLSEMFPELEMELRWADEDAGSNVGMGKFHKGIYYEDYLPADGSKEAMELYFELHEGMEEYYKLNDEGEYVYDEGDDGEDEE